MSKPPRVARVALIVALLVALVTAIEAVIGSLILLPAALVPLLAAIGMARRRVWGAWGYATYLLAGALMLPIVLTRSGSGAAPGALAIASLLISGFTLALAVLFYRAGRALEQAGAVRGSWIPWAVLTCIATAPFFFYQAFSVPTGSMEDTLLIGDKIIVQRLPGPHPQLNEIMALHYPVDRRQIFLKRIVGMPGDRIRVRQKTLYRNGVACSEPWAVHKADYLDSYRDNFPSEPNTVIFAPAMRMLNHNVVNDEVVVPAGQYFVMGDNRDQSLDSRYWGFVSESDFIGKAVMIYDSSEQAPEQSETRRGPTRWSRIFRLL